jgi:hypothetical protein
MAGMSVKSALLVANLPIVATLIAFQLMGGVSVWFTLTAGIIILALVNSIAIYKIKKGRLGVTADHWKSRR